MEIYQAEMTCGYGDDNYCHTIYVGTDRTVAIARMMEYGFPSEYSQWGYLYTWVGGQIVKSEVIRE